MSEAEHPTKPQDLPDVGGSAVPSVAGVVLNYNGREVTQVTLGSLLELSYPVLDLLVVDNGSTDGSWEAIREAFPAVRQLRVEENRGISWGLNHGIRWARESGYDYVLLMNNDIEVDREMLQRLVVAMEEHPSAGCAGPKCYYHGDRERIWSAGGSLRWRETVTRERGDGELDRGQYDRTEFVPYINGCAMLVRGTALEQVPYWDPVYYLGVEDADFCVRLKQAGWRCLYVHDAHLWHMISHSIGVYRPTRTFHTGRSSAIYLRRYARPWHWARVLAFALVAIPAATLRELPRRNVRAVYEKWRGFWHGLWLEIPPIPDPPLAVAEVGTREPAVRP